MEPSVKNQVLMAIYTEYQKSIPDMKNINYKVLGISRDEFKIAVAKLANEKFISGAIVHPGGDSNIPAMVALNDVQMTTDGIDHVEQNLGIEADWSEKEKVEKVIDFAKQTGLDFLSDVASKVIVEMIKS